jgi:peptidoglycan hydrolase CwlO-like protein
MKAPVTKYYILLEESEHGPFSIAELKGLLSDQIADSETPAREEADSTWKSIAEILKTPHFISNDTIQEENIKAKPNYQNLIIGGISLILLILISINYIITKKALSEIQNDIDGFDNLIKEKTYANDIKILRNELVELNLQISTLQESNNENSLEVKKIKENYTINKKFLADALDKLINQYTEKLSELSKTFENRNNEIETNLQEISTFSKSISDLKNSFKILNKNYELLTNDIKKLDLEKKEDLVKIDAKVKSCDERIRILSSSLENIQRQIPKRN